MRPIAQCRLDLNPAIVGIMRQHMDVERCVVTDGDIKIDHTNAVDHRQFGNLARDSFARRYIDFLGAGQFRPDGFKRLEVSITPTLVTTCRKRSVHIILPVPKAWGGGPYEAWWRGNARTAPPSRLRRATSPCPADTGRKELAHNIMPPPRSLHSLHSRAAAPVPARRSSQSGRSREHGRNPASLRRAGVDSA
jgi:hypothetical protein